MKVICTNDYIALCWFNLDNNIQVVEIHDRDSELDSKMPYSNGKPLKRYFYGLKGNKPYVTDGVNEYPYNIGVTELLTHYKGH